MLHKETIEKKTLELLKELQSIDIISETLLVGGTSLALQIGHRTSVALDIFTTKEFDLQELQNTLENKFDFTPRRIFGQSIIGDINGVKVDIIYHPFRWIGNPITDGNIRLASIKDITAMKLHAIINSGKRPKDFVDLAYLSNYFSYDTMKIFLIEKYPKYDPIMADRAINYFDEIESHLIPEIKMINDKLDFNKIKNRLVKMTDRPEHIFITPPLEKQKKTKRLLP